MVSAPSSRVKRPMQVIPGCARLSRNRGRLRSKARKPSFGSPIVIAPIVSHDEHMPERSTPRAEPVGSRVDAERRWLRTDNILLVAALGLFVWFTGDVLLLIFAGLLLGVGLDGLASAVDERTPLSHGWALLLVGVLAIALIAAIGMTVVPQFLGELDELWERLGS